MANQAKNFRIADVLKQAASTDADHRYMAVNDLGLEINREDFVPLNSEKEVRRGEARV